MPSAPIEPADESSGEQTTAQPTSNSVPDDSAFQRKFDKYIERTEKTIEQLTGRQSLSGQEFDKQIVALAGGGLALTITLSKDLLTKNTGWIWMLFASWGAFLLALTMNLISHRTSTRHYNLMIERQQHYLDCAEDDNKDIDEDLDQRLKRRINYRTKWVEGLNLGALIACLAGIAFFIAFTLYNKYHTNGRHRTTSTPAVADVRSGHHQKPVGNLDTTQSTTATTPDSGKHHAALFSDSSRRKSKQLSK
jgi:hypothetical protein